MILIDIVMPFVISKITANPKAFEIQVSQMWGAFSLFGTDVSKSGIIFPAIFSLNVLEEDKVHNYWQL